MARNAIESDFRSYKMAQYIQNGGRRPFWKTKLKKSFEMHSKVIFGNPKWYAGSHFVNNIFKQKLRIDLKWWEMWSQVICGHPKWPQAAILWKKIKVAYWSEMTRNAIKSDYRSSKMAAGSHFVKNKVAYWSEMTRNAIESDFRSSKMVAGSHFVNKIKNWVLIWNGEKCDWSSKMAAGSHFVKKNQVLLWNGEKCDRNSFSVIQNGGGGGITMANTPILVYMWPQTPGLFR